MAIKKRYQVFVSSTYEDLKGERQVAVEAILKAGHIPAGMELFAGGSQSQLDVIREWIGESDIFVLVLGGRYGTIEKTSGKSYIQLEYEHAIDLGKPFFAVVLDDDGLDAKVKASGRAALETDNGPLFKAFREVVRSKICKHFSNGPSLQAAIYESLFDIIRRHEATMVGWVSGGDASDSAEANRRIASLSEENQRLRRDLDAALALTPPILPPERDRALDEFYEQLKSVSVLRKRSGQREKIRTALAEFFEGVGNATVTGAAAGDDVSAVSALELFGLVTTFRHQATGSLMVKNTPLGNRLLLYLKRKKALDPEA